MSANIDSAARFATMGYRASQRAAYMPPPCPKCGSTNIDITWQPCTDQQSTEPEWDLGASRCLDCPPKNALGFPG